MKILKLSTICFAILSFAVLFVITSLDIPAPNKIIIKNIDISDASVE